MGAKSAKNNYVDPRAMGIVSGVSDVLLLLPRGAFGGLCVEFKTENGVLSDRQRDWGVSMLEAGYLYQIVRSESRFRSLIEKYLSL
jgi:hypothetical protein